MFTVRSDDLFLSALQAERFSSSVQRRPVWRLASVTRFFCPVTLKIRLAWSRLIRATLMLVTFMLAAPKQTEAHWQSSVALPRRNFLVIDIPIVRHQVFAATEGARGLLLFVHAFALSGRSPPLNLYSRHSANSCLRSGLPLAAASSAASDFSPAQ